MVTGDNDFDLMRYADGELDGDEASAVKQRVDGDRQAFDRIAGVRELGEALRTRLELEADRVESQGKFASMWARIEESVKGLEPQPARIVVGTPRLMTRLAAWWDSFHGYVLTGAGATAAVLLFVVAVRPFERVVKRTVPGQSPVVLTPAVAKSQPPEIEKLEVYQGTGIILTVPGDDGDAPTAVIWSDNSQDLAEGPL